MPPVMPLFLSSLHVWPIVVNVPAAASCYANKMLLLVYRMKLPEAVTGLHFYKMDHFYCLSGNQVMTVLSPALSITMTRARESLKFNADRSSTQKCGQGAQQQHCLGQVTSG